MNPEDLKKILDALSAADVREFALKTGEFDLSLRRGPQAMQGGAALPSASSGSTAAAGPGTSQPAASQPAASVESASPRPQPRRPQRAKRRAHAARCHAGGSGQGQRHAAQGPDRRHLLRQLQPRCSALCQGG